MGFFVSDWLIEKNLNPDFEDTSTEELNKLLRRFYGEVQPKKGHHYSRSAYLNIRNGINRHLNGPPFSRNTNIMQDREFGSSNQIFTAVLKEMRRAGLDQTRHKAIIEPEDIEKMYKTGTLSTSDPVALQRKVFFDLSFHFTRREREGLRALEKNKFRN